MAALPHDYETMLYSADTFKLEDHFNHYVTADDFTTVASDSGTVSVSDGVGGRVSLVASDGSVVDNDETYMRSTTELFLVAQNKPIRARCRLQYTEANTDDANVMFGLMNAIAANAIVDDGAGLRTTGNYFCFFKVDGGTKWQVRSRNSTDTFTNDTGVTAGGASFQVLDIEIDNQGSGGTNVIVHFKIDGQMCYDATTNLPIEHVIPIASSTEMHLGAGVKNGAANLETLVVDYIGACQKL